MATETGTTRRHRLIRGMAQALRAVGQDNSPSQGEIRDVLAFLALSLGELNASVEETASAWERRAYWLKADRFRSEWSWVPRIHARLEAALRVEDLGEAQACGMELANLLADRRLRTLKAGGARPWGGAWDAWVKKR